MRTLVKELTVGLRSLRRMPGSALISVVVLALGIGLCSFMFSVVYGVYYRGLNVPDPGRVFVLMTTRAEGDQFNRPVPIQDLADWRERQSSFTGLLGTSGATVNVSDAEEPRRFQGERLSANALDVLQVYPILGRGFAQGDDAPGAPPNVLLGYAAWRDHYGLDPGVIGRPVRVNGEPAEIIGVMPEGFKFPSNDEVWIPLRDDPLETSRGAGPSVMVIGRLRDGVSRDQAELEMASIAEQLAREYPESNEGIGARLETPSRAATGGPLDVVFTALMIAVTCVLLVACANVANLLLARAAMRTKEAGVRVALGGGRLRVMAPFLAEAAVLAAAGALLGILIAHVAIGWFDGVTDPARTGRPYFIRFHLDLPILAYVGGLTVFTALAAGLAPAWQVSRTDLTSVLKDEARGSSGLHMGRLSRVLVTAEVALSCALLVGAGLMTKSILNLRTAEYAYETERLFTARVALPESDYPDAEARRPLWDAVLREVRALPGVAAAGLASQLPLAGESRGNVALDGTVYEDVDAMPSLARVVVTPGYFGALGIGVTSGRDFTDLDAEGSDLVTIVNQPMVDRYFDGRSPIGRQIREGAADSLPWLTIVGVVPDLGIGGPLIDTGDFEPAGYYVPLGQSDPPSMSIAALPRTGGALALTSDVRRAVRLADPDLPIFDIWTQADIIDRRTWFFGVFGTLFIAFGAAAMFMASVGLYGVLSFAVSRRTQEMGIRMALGAGARDVVGLVARQGATQLSIGLGIGLALAFGLTRVIGPLMYRVDPQDPLVFGGVVVMIALVGVAAGFFPARRATGVDPVEALRYE